MVCTRTHHLVIHLVATVCEGLDLLSRSLLFACRHGIYFTKQLVHTFEGNAFRLREDENNADLEKKMLGLAFWRFDGRGKAGWDIPMQQRSMRTIASRIWDQLLG